MEEKFRRIILIDIARGLAIIGVVIYHFAFDLKLLNFIQTDVTENIFWVAFARILASSFLFLVGVSLVFAHGNKIRWKPFLKRVLIIGIAALGISVATFFAFPDMFIYFGILHAIALFSILALPFLKAPLWLIGFAAFLVIFSAYTFSFEVFNQKIFSWIGFWQIPPYTSDLVPIFPAFGATLLGVFFARFAIKKKLVNRLADFSPKGLWTNFLIKSGKWSLIIYLIHQPILLGILYPIAFVVKPNELTKEQAFYGACFSNCLEVSGGATNCKNYCNCSLEQVEENRLWEIINLPILTKEQNQEIISVSKLCSALAKE